MDPITHFVHPDELERYRHDAAPQLIDCRSPGEFAAGHIPGSVNIPLEEIGARTHDIDTARPVVFICASGRRATAAAERIASGTPVAVLEGGVTTWAGSGRELIVTAASTWALERQVRLAAGSIAALGAIAGLFDPRWATVPIFIGLGLTVAALTNTCAMGTLLMRMPWNRRRA
jgi:rhodanese-related sulfurtransferase